MLKEQAEDDLANFAQLQRCRQYAAQFIGQVIEDALNNNVPPLPAAPRTRKAVV